MEQTFHFQVKGAAVKLVLVGDFASVVPGVVFFGFDDVHLKCVDLPEWETVLKVGLTSPAGLVVRRAVPSFVGQRSLSVAGASPSCSPDPSISL